jgi:5-methylcytosine-specific restriction endonuclease McrA
MDHIVPLIQANGDLQYWRLPNLQTLCTPCHTIKTSREATERAAARRLLKEKDSK